MNRAGPNKPATLKIEILQWEDKEKQNFFNSQQEINQQCENYCFRR